MLYNYWYLSKLCSLHLYHCMLYSCLQPRQNHLDMHYKLGHLCKIYKRLERHCIFYSLSRRHSSLSYILCK
ncbi:unnamed protein product [Blepharisma stoltei]|uniref:Uncharacterized protein n=1 Tax=Blepharisma stoltei TaxID=1481888 RepID=A0AAU9KAT8_9CILI|nr:unnamed protein product [Blepharisma stoltei]